MTKLTLTASAFALTAFLPAALSAATMTFDPTADGHVRVFGGDAVVDTEATLSVQQSGGLADNGIFEYDLSAIDDNAIINSVSFTITLNRFVSNLGAPAAVDLFAYNGDGVIDIADFNAAGTQVVDTTTPRGGVRGDTRTFVFDTTQSVADALAGDLLTIRMETDSFASFSLTTLENPNFAAAQLTIDYSLVEPEPIPLPAGLPLLAAGLGAFAWMRRKS